MADESGNSPITVPGFRSLKGKRKLAMVTAYDYSSARIADEAGVESILVGDSLGTVVQGLPNTVPVKLSEMVYHTQLAARGVKRALLIADLPFGSYQESPRQAVRNAVRLMKAGARAIKLEGGERVADTIAALVKADIPVVGHVGLTPQSVHLLGGFKVQRNREQILQDAVAVDQSGAFALVLECVPSEIGQAATQAVSIPTVGIGAGLHCDGQVLVWHDLLGLYDDFRPRFVKRYAELGETASQAIRRYIDEVRDGSFPGPEHEFQ